jgi:hypothetical protein
VARSKRRVIEAAKFTDRGPQRVPPFLVLSHRHFEKNPPPNDGMRGTFTVPLDFFRTLKVPSWLLSDIDEVTVTYRKRSST